MQDESVIVSAKFFKKRVLISGSVSLRSFCLHIITYNIDITVQREVHGVRANLQKQPLKMKLEKERENGDKNQENKS